MTKDDKGLFPANKVTNPIKKVTFPKKGSKVCCCFFTSWSSINADQTVNVKHLNMKSPNIIRVFTLKINNHNIKKNMNMSWLKSGWIILDISRCPALFLEFPARFRESLANIFNQPQIQYPLEILHSLVDFPIKNGGSFQFVFCKRLPEGNLQRWTITVSICKDQVKTVQDFPPFFVNSGHQCFPASHFSSISEIPRIALFLPYALQTTLEQILKLLNHYLFWHTLDRSRCIIRCMGIIHKSSGSLRGTSGLRCHFQYTRLPAICEVAIGRHWEKNI